VHRRASVPSYPHHHRSMVDYVTRPWSTARGPSPRDFLYENNSLFPVYSEILQKGPQTFGYSSRGLEVLQSDPWFLKNNSREVPSPKKIHKIALKTSNVHIFPTTTLNSVILVPKFPESLPLSLFPFVIHMFVAFIYCLCFAYARNRCARAVR
jgi:hypothetical protein